MQSLVVEDVKEEGSEFQLIIIFSARTSSINSRQFN